MTGKHQLNPAHYSPEVMPYYDPLGVHPHDIPDVGIFDEPRVYTCINARWLSHLTGMMERLLYLDAWKGTEAEKYSAIDKVTKIIAEFDKAENMNCCCGQSTLVLSRTTSTGDLEISSDGGTTWIPDPSDPRKTVTAINPLPAGIVNLRCQAAWNTRKLMEGAINAVAGVLDVTLTLLAIATAIAGVLAVLLFNPTQAYKLVPVVIQLAVSIAALSETDFLAAFTTTVYDDFQCLIYCNTDASGNVNVNNVRSGLPSKFSGIALNGFSLIITGIGDIGVNNMARTDAGTIAHDCASCACDGCDLSGWTIYNSTGVIVSQSSTEIVITPIDRGDGKYGIGIKSTSPNDCCCNMHSVLYLNGVATNRNHVAQGVNPCGSDQNHAAYNFSYTGTSVNHYEETYPIVAGDSNVTIHVTSSGPC